MCLAAAFGWTARLHRKGEELALGEGRAFACQRCACCMHAQVADPRELLRTLRQLHFEDGLSLEDVIPLFTSQPAARLQLLHKGSVRAQACLMCHVKKILFGH